MGLSGKKIEWHHDPSLGLRLRTKSGGYDPDENDPKFIRPVVKEEHKVITNGTHVPLSGDKSKIAKLVRVEGKQGEHERAMALKRPGRKRPKSGKWPEQKRTFR